MFDIECDVCGAPLVVDEMMTIDEYHKDANYLFDDIWVIADDSLQDYIVYRCIECKAVYRFNYADWSLRYRRSIAKYVMESRKQKMFADQIDPKKINPNNGLEFCGQCSGSEGDGNCWADVIKQCTIRKDK